METIKLMWEKLCENLIYTPLLAFFLKPVKEKVNNILKSIWPWYVNSIYKSASANNINRPSIFSLVLLVGFVFVTSELFLLSIFNPSLPAIDNAISSHQNQADKIFLTLIFLINLLLFVLVMRLEIIQTTISRFNQMLMIIRPDIKPEEYYEWRQKWALMKSANDYKKIVNELFSKHKILRNNKEKFPDEIIIFEKEKQKEESI